MDFNKAKFSEVLNDELDNLYSLLMKKNASYGASVFQPPILCPGLPPRVALLSRMSDKINRLFSGGAIEGETFDDTLRDLAGYIVLYFVMKNFGFADKEERND